MLVAVVSVKGSPGVTTLAVALAARWPAGLPIADGEAAPPPVVVEADPAGGDLAARFGLRTTPGLASLATAVRSTAGMREPDPFLLWRHAQALPGGAAVVAAPPDAEQARSTVAALADGGDGLGALRAAANRPGAAVIVDCGRVDPGSPVEPLLAAADAMLLLARPAAEDLAHLVRRLSRIGTWSPHPHLLLAGPGHSFAEIERELGVRATRRIPHDPTGAAVLSGRSPARWWSRHGPARSALGEEAGRLAGDLIWSLPTTATAAAASSAELADPAPRPRTRIRRLRRAS